MYDAAFNRMGAAMNRAMFVFALAALCCQPLYAAAPDDLSGLASQLAGYRDACATQAATANIDYSTAQYQASLDMGVAATQARMDAKVYRVGHGSKETRDFQLARLHGDTSAQGQKLQQIEAKKDADSKQIVACVAGAEQRGKAAYADFIASHHGKRAKGDAAALMTAWLTNMEEITFDTPHGSAATDAQWKTAKSHAEIAAIQ